MYSDNRLHQRIDIFLVAAILVEWLSNYLLGSRLLLLIGYQLLESKFLHHQAVVVPQVRIYQPRDPLLLGVRDRKFSMLQLLGHNATQVLLRHMFKSCEFITNNTATGFQKPAISKILRSRLLTNIRQVNLSLSQSLIYLLFFPRGYHRT